MVSPNMQYPKVIAAGQQKIVQGLEQKQAGGGSPYRGGTGELTKAKASYEKNKNGTSFISAWISPSSR